jgi:hypothetical protein
LTGKKKGNVALFYLELTLNQRVSNVAFVGYPPVDRDEVYKEIFEQTENIKKNRRE